MNTLNFELRQIAHSRLAVGAIVLRALLCALSVWTGLQAVSQQRAALDRIASSHAQDYAAIAAKQLKSGEAEAGSVGYYLPHLTVNPPSPLAFVAIGQRDLGPESRRIIDIKQQIKDLDENIARIERQSLRTRGPMVGGSRLAAAVLHLDAQFLAHFGGEHGGARDLSR